MQVEDRTFIQLKKFFYIFFDGGNMHKKGLLYSIVFIIFISTQIFSQPLLEENFDYDAGTLLTNVGWIFSSGTTNPLTVTSPGLTFTNYPSVSGNALTLANTGEDDYMAFAPQTSGDVYLFLLANVTSAQSGDYFIALSPSTLQYNYYARLHVKASNSGFLLGISKSNEVAGGALYGTTELSFNTTYLVGVKYSFNSADTTDDVINVYVFADGTLPATEPSTPEVGPYSYTSKNDATDLGYVTIRQGSSSYAANLIIDGIRISTSWSDAVLPVELASFTSVVKNNNVILKWKTATELNNKGFEIYRNNVMIKFVPGFGTTSESNVYQYVDKNLNNGIYSYNLVQVDLNGMKKTVGTIEATVNKIPAEFSISQNYPNPFNPSTVIKFALPTDAKVSLKVYNILGVEVSTLINNNLTAGVHEAKFNASNLNSGIYFYNITARGVDGSVNSNTMKMMYLK